MRSPHGSSISSVGTIAIKQGNLFLIAGPDGQLPFDEEGPLGLWFRDCRFLSGYELRVAGALPLLLAASDTSGSEALHELTNPDLQVGGTRLPAQSLRIRVVRSVEAPGTLRERLTVRTYHRAALRLPLELRLWADFEPMLALRGLVPPAAREEPAFGPDGFAAVGRDGVRRSTALSLRPAPARSEGGVLAFELELDSGESGIELELRVSEEGGAAAAAERPSGAVTKPPSTAVAKPPSETEAARPAPGGSPPFTSHVDGPRVRSDDRLFNRVLSRSLVDLSMLRSELDGLTYYAAGLPWYATLFGRDSLIAALQTLAFDPGVAETTLRLLAARLGRELDDQREEQPGKVLHELRVGEPAALAETPFARYYGTADATPLFLCLLCDHADWSGSLDLFRELRPQVDAALEWVDRYGDLDGDGFVEYAPRSPQGLVNHGWKDSGEGVPEERGEPLEPPVAMVEVQGYVIRAKRRMASLFELDGDAARAQRLRADAACLQDLLQRFWLPDIGGYAIALDGAKRPGSGFGSNQGHLLWAGAVSAERAARVRGLLMGSQMFSGWGVRTLGEGHALYNPVGYHIGSVWPHDNAMIAVGLRRYGFDEDFTRIFDGVLEAASLFEQYRLPELFAGYPRSELEIPVPCPVACRPQAWAAGAVPYLLTAGLGIVPDGLERRLHVVRPSLPTSVDRVDVLGLRLAGAGVDLHFERGADGVALADARTEGDVEVMLD